jgi:hypothetical protein
MSRKRFSAKKSRIPSWLSEEELLLIQEAYSIAKLRTEVTGIEWQVDHILPLQGKLVSGLHVLTNLQVVPATWNQSKSNSYNPALSNEQRYLGV